MNDNNDEQQNIFVLHQIFIRSYFEQNFATKTIELIKKNVLYIFKIHEYTTSQKENNQSG